MASSPSSKATTTSRASTRNCWRPTTKGIICLSGCASGEFSEYILKDQLDEAGKAGRVVRTACSARTSTSRSRTTAWTSRRQCAEGAIDIANKLGLPLVATSDAHYLTQADAAAHDVLLCINTGQTQRRTRTRYATLRAAISSTSAPPEEMYRLFPGHEDAVKRSQEIADGCSHRAGLQGAALPRLHAARRARRPKQYLRELCYAGLRDRYGDNPSQAVRDRLEHELGIICRMGFASYFLIVGDFVRFAVENGIPASARGSACGALVSYVLKLSHVDPLEYDLLFERFLDPNRSRGAGHRHRLLPGPPRRGHRLRHAASTARAAWPRSPRSARWPPGPPSRTWAACWTCRWSASTQLTKMIPKALGITLDDALKQSPDLQAGLRHRPGRARADRHRPQAGGDQPQRRHPRRRRGDRQRPADRLRAAAARHPQGRRRRRPRRRGGGDDAMGHGRPGKGRPAQDGLPGPAHADAAGQLRAADREDARREDRPVQAAAGRRGDVRSCCSAATPRACSSSSRTASASCSSG